MYDPQCQFVQSRLGGAGEKQYSDDGSFLRAGSSVPAFSLRKYPNFLTQKNATVLILVFCMYMYEGPKLTTTKDKDYTNEAYPKRK